MEKSIIGRKQAYKGKEKSIIGKQAYKGWEKYNRETSV